MKSFVFLFFSGLLFLSCNSDDNVIAETDYSEYITGNSVNTTFNFMPEEIYTDGDAQQSPLLKLKLISEEMYPCINYELVTTEFRNGNELIIRFDEINEPVLCYTAIGPAISYIDLPENIHKITFINGNEIDKYSVKTTEQKVSITLIESNFTSSLYDKTFRIPENSFAFVCGTNTTNTNIYDDFSAILEQNPNFTEFSFEGEGRIPYQESTSGHWVNHPSKYYIYSNPAEFNNLGNVLNDFSQQHIEPGSGVTIAIYGWDNVKFRSWITN